MILDVKYDINKHRIVCKDLESGIVGKVIRVHNPADASRIMDSLDTDSIRSHIEELKTHMQKGRIV